MNEAQVNAMGKRIKFFIERNIPLTLIFIVLTQVFVGVVFAATLTNRVDVLEKQTDKLDGVNVRQELMQHQLNRIEQKVDRILEK